MGRERVGTGDPYSPACAGMTLDTQSVSSVARQLLAIIGIVFGVLTQSVSSLHLPVALSAVITIGGAVILAIEHYVADLSTGTSTKPPSAGP